MWESLNGLVNRFSKRRDRAWWSAAGPIERVTLVDIGSERQLHLDAATYLTGDQSMISLDAVIRFAVTDAELYAYAAAYPDRALEEFARAAIVEGLRGKTKMRCSPQTRCGRACVVGCTSSPCGFSRWA